MISPGIRSLALLFALAGPLASAAAAQTAKPALRESATVTSDIVRIGDLVENAGPVADVAIFRSPDPGTTGAVETGRVVEAIRPYELVDIDTRGLAEVVVTRSSRAILPQEISARVAQVLSEQCGLGKPPDISVNFDRDVRTLEVEPNAAGELHVLALSCDPRTARFGVTFDLPTSAELHRHPARFTGTAFETVAAVAVEHPVERGEVLKTSDLTVLRQPKSEAGTLSEIEAAVGLAARHQLRPGQPLHASDLMKPDIVARNDTVTIVYETPGLVLTLRGQAQDGGTLGDTIGVLNVDSKRVIQGTITGPGRVTVQAVTTRVVDNTPMVVSPSPPAETSE